MCNATIICDDSLEALDGIADGSIQLVMSSPPYNIRKEYELDHRMSLSEYLDWLDPIVEKLCHKISDTGSICWQVGNHIKNGEVFPLDFYFYKIFTENNFKLRNRIIWHFNFGLHANNRFSGRYETILWFSKGDNYKFNLDPVRIPQLYPGKRHSWKKNGNAGKPSGNPLGKNPSDFWEFSGSDSFIENPIWDLPNVKANHPEKTIHPCQFPSELAERCILALSDEGDTILDPFVGSGTSVIAAVKHNRTAIGIEKNQEYANLANERIRLFKDGKLKLRESGKAVRKPRKGEKVSTVPNEWIETLNQ